MSLPPGGERVPGASFLRLNCKKARHGRNFKTRNFVRTLTGSAEYAKDIAGQVRDVHHRRSE